MKLITITSTVGTIAISIKNKILRLPIPKMGFVPRKFNISANKIAIYAITVCG